jgi:long-chain acyl-CoA synthetase
VDERGARRENRVGADGAARQLAMAGNLADLFARHLENPGAVLYRHAGDRGWVDVTAGDLGREIARWQAALRREGCAEGDRIALVARNGPAWVAADLAALGLGLVVVPLYVDDNPANAAWCASDAGARLVVVESLRLAQGLAKAGATTAARMVVLRQDGAPPGLDGVVGVDAFLPPAGGPLEVRELAPGTLATICYTSGTAGRPKGVMLSHGNILANVEACATTGMARPTDRFLSVLPLSHMFERTGGYYLPLAIGATVVFARGIAQLAEDLAAQQPTVMFAVPRIFERLAARIDRALVGAPVRRALVDACAKRGYRVSRGDASPVEQVVVAALRRLVARPILRRLGGRMRLAVVGGAPFDPALARFFIGLGLPLLAGYGLTEASPVVSVNRDDDIEPDSVGPPLPGVEVRWGDGGELLVRAPSVMLGYWKNEAATRAAIDADGWLHTGDLADMAGGKIRIRGRAKDILVLSNGEKLPPQDAELAILRDPAFEQAMLVGEGRPYPILLAVTQDTDEAALLRRANAQLAAFPRWVRVRRVIAAREPWDAEGGLMTPTMKLRRAQVAARFADRIEAAYASLAD